MAAAAGDGCVRGRAAGAGRRLCHRGSVTAPPGDGRGEPRGDQALPGGRRHLFPRGRGSSGGAAPSEGHLRKERSLPWGRAGRAVGAAGAGAPLGGGRIIGCSGPSGTVFPRRWRAGGALPPPYRARCVVGGRLCGARSPHLSRR